MFVLESLSAYSRKKLIFPHSAKSDKFDGISFSLIQRGKRLNLLSPKISIARVKVKPFLIFRQSVTRNLASLRRISSGHSWRRFHAY